MNKLYVCLALLPILFSSCHSINDTEVNATMCNPLPLNYDFMVEEGVSRRDGAHPCVVLFRDVYYLFMSNIQGYYKSDDLLHWTLVTTNLPTIGNAPAAVEMDGQLYLTFSGATGTFYHTATPELGRWEVTTNSFPYDVAEPSLFYDEGRLFLYSGSGNKVSLTGMEIDPKTFLPLTQTMPLITDGKPMNGWEVAGDYHDWKTLSSWIEGTWMTKRDSKYYLQYASSGIQYTGSNQGVYVADNPLGPFVLATHNPFVYKPEGFTKGAGNGCLFQDRYGNDWYMGTTGVSVRHIFERRIVLHPVFFDKDSLMYAYTGFGDYPMSMPTKKINSPEELATGWMLLSYRKLVRVSSEQRKHPACCAVDESIRSWWSAETGDTGEFLSLDLGEVCEVRAVQINFADEEAQLSGSVSDTYQYHLETSTDGKKWKPVGEKSLRITDTPHDYVVLEKPLASRYLRITNVHVPAGKFSVSGFRVFGKADKLAPSMVESWRGLRDVNDRRNATLRWNNVEDAVGYNIRYGKSPDKLYHNYIVYGDNEIIIKGLHAEWEYYFAIDSFNEGGITRGEKVEKVL